MALSDLQEDLADDLAEPIARAHGEQGAGEMARMVLERDSGQTVLVGLTERRRQAVYYDAEDRGLWLMPFTRGGLDEYYSTRVTTLDHLQGIEGLLHDGKVEFGWVHPRFRWATSIS